MEVAVEQPAAPQQRPVPWSLILIFGGAGWLVVTVIAILWLQPMSGKVISEAGEHSAPVYYLSTMARALQHLLIFALSALAYRLAFTRRFPNYREHPVYFVLLHLLLVALVIRLAPFAAGIAAAVVDLRFADFRDTAMYWMPFDVPLVSLLTPLQFFLPPYLLGLALVSFAIKARDYHLESLRSARLWAAYSDARLAMLSAQLQPHFLFNALHATAELVSQSPERATLMLARLGDFLRHALESSKQPWVNVATEAAGIEAYLAVQTARFSDRLSIAIAIEPATEALSIPSMLLQPLVENAVEHGRCSPCSSLAVTIRVALAGERLRLVVRNSTPQISGPIPHSAFGNGLKNVESRLRAAYGAAATVVVGPDSDGGTVATIDLPARRVGPQPIALAELGAS